ncbi:MAG: peptidoglycan DD-metalloendopeptidase family protein [Breoghania sp.]|nr:peptidoglycan DD-metalloendopeptidase family protein [Breoghania sp.]
MHFRSRLLTRVAAIALLAGFAAGCSRSVERFGDPIYTGGTANQRDILANPPSQPSYDEVAGNGAVSPAPQKRAPTVASAPLPPVGHSRTNKPLYTASIPKFEPIAQPAQSAMPAPIASNTQPRYGGWRSAGGTVVTLESRETVDSAARRYGVPPKAIVAVNGIGDPDLVHAGSQIIIPTYVYNGHKVVNPTRRTAAAETTAVESRTAGAVPSAPAKPTRIKTVRVATRIEVIPDSKPRQVLHTASAPRAAVSAAPEQHTASIDTNARPPRKPSVSSGSAPRVAVATAEPETRSATHTDVKHEARREEAPKAPIKTASIQQDETPAAVATDNTNRFRWPVRGRIISSFGSKPGGTRNDGINLAVPEGTAMRAVESGTVIYSGNELKGYGNLVLIRHEGGWVSAYAHNSELEVRRGDIVRRGEVVAKAGSTGTVNQPQLHFELRQGNKPVDPMQYLPKSS